MQLIDANKALRIIEAIQQNKDIPNYGTLLDIKRRIRRLPTIDAEPVVHAHWHLFDSDLGYKIFRCSKCSYERVIEDEEIPDYCEKCGAKMDEEQE